MGNIREVECKTPQDFLAHMRMTHSVWRGQSSSRWAFRGQADADWKLTPKAFRSTTNLSYGGDDVFPPLPPEQQRRAELRALNFFIFLADRAGLPIPGDGQHLRLPDTVQLSPPGLDRWPWPGVLEVLAIAQHHGVPTRLVDFTHNPMIAAFFAAHSGWLHDRDSGLVNGGSKHLVVWGIELDSVSLAVETHRTKGERPSVIWVTASRAENTFLHQQDALFLLDLEADTRPSPPDLKDAVLDAPGRAGLDQPSAPQIIRVLLPRTFAAEVLRLLSNEFYHPARLMPTYDNVVRTLELKRELRRSSDEIRH